MAYSRNLDRLHPIARRLIDKWLAVAAREGIDVLITCVDRDLAEQAALWRYNRPYVAIEAQVYRLKRLGLDAASEALRTCPPQGGKTGPRRTKAPPGLSFHNPHTYQGATGSFAVDFCPVSGGKPMWKDTHTFGMLGKLAEEQGLTWAGRWKAFLEVGHVQWDDLRKIQILKLAKGAYA